MGAGAQPEINKATKALLGPLLESGEGVIETRDIAYGDHPRQCMDIYSATALKQAPVVIYIPGGGFTGGDKRQDERFFGNVGRFFAKRGVVAVIGNYRLAPEFTWPAAAEDVAHIVAWVKANIAKFGGDHSRVFLFGHSAGASHAASFLFDPELKGDEQICGAILSSGLYVLRTSEMRPNVAQYFGTDERTFERRSVLSHVSGTKIPVLLTTAEYDPVPLATPTFDLAIALTRRDGRPPKVMWLEDHNHYSCISSLGTSDTRYSGAVLDFIKKFAGIRSI
jgi:triacylglycerol lipase